MRTAVSKPTRRSCTTEATSWRRPGGGGGQDAGDGLRAWRSHQGQWRACTRALQTVAKQARLQVRLHTLALILENG